MIYTANVYSYNEMKLDLDPVENLVINEQELLALNEISIGEVFKKIIDWLKDRWHDFVKWVKNLKLVRKVLEMKAKKMAEKAMEIEFDDENIDWDDYETEEEPVYDTEEEPDTNDVSTKPATKKYKFTKKSVIQHGYDLYKAAHGYIAMDAIPRGNSIYGDEYFVKEFEEEIELCFKDILDGTSKSMESYLLNDEITEKDCYKSLVMTPMNSHRNFIKSHGLYDEFFSGLRLKNAKEFLNRINSTPKYGNKMFYSKVQKCPTVEELKSTSFFIDEINYVTKCIDDMSKMYNDLESKISKIQRKVIADVNKLDTKKQNLVYRLVSRVTIIVQNSVSYTTAMAGVIDTYVNNIYTKLYPEIIRAYVKYGKQNSVDNERLKFNNLKPEGFTLYNESVINNDTRSLFESVCLL